MKIICNAQIKTDACQQFTVHNLPLENVLQSVQMKAKIVVPKVQKEPLILAVILIIT